MYTGPCSRVYPQYGPSGRPHDVACVQKYRQGLEICSRFSSANWSIAMCVQTSSGSLPCIYRQCSCSRPRLSVCAQRGPRRVRRRCLPELPMLPRGGYPRCSPGAFASGTGRGDCQPGRRYLRQNSSVRDALWRQSSTFSTSSKWRSSTLFGSVPLSRRLVSCESMKARSLPCRPHQALISSTIGARWSLTRSR